MNISDNESNSVKEVICAINVYETLRRMELIDANPLSPKYLPVHHFVLILRRNKNK